MDIFWLCRVDDTTKLKREDWDHMIITPVQFHGHVIRKLSDWCSVVPDISIDAELPSLDVQLGPGDYSAILSLVNSLSDGQPTAPPANKGKGGDDVEEGEKAHDEGNKDNEAFSDAASNNYMKLLMRFKMKEVKFLLW